MAYHIQQYNGFQINKQYKIKVMHQSLYEYLGHAAGSALGKDVAKAAKLNKITITSHNVSTPKYTGTILKYPVEFLDQYFISTLLTKDDKSSDNLPL
jgi:hypothetical protein